MGRNWKEIHRKRYGHGARRKGKTRAWGLSTLGLTHTRARTHRRRHHVRNTTAYGTQKAFDRAPGSGLVGMGLCHEGGGSACQGDASWTGWTSSFGIRAWGPCFFAVGSLLHTPFATLAGIALLEGAPSSGSAGQGLAGLTMSGLPPFCSI